MAATKLSALKATAGVLLLMSLTACVSYDYARIDPATKTYFGYADSQNPDGTHMIRVYLPSNIPDSKLARQYWDRRAAEICGHTDFHGNIYAATRHAFVNPGYGAPQPGNYLMEGTLDCGSKASETSPPPVAD
ncbi:MAG: hypothetical protein ACREEY_09415 [Brevundimonas sp.]